MDETVDYNGLMEFKKSYSLTKPQTQHPALIGGGKLEAEELGSEGAAASASESCC